MKNRTIGRVTASSAIGGAVGAALATILVWILNEAGVDAGAIEGPITVILTAVLTLVGGWAVPGTTTPAESDALTGHEVDNYEYDGDPEAVETEADREPRHSAKEVD